MGYSITLLSLFLVNSSSRLLLNLPESQNKYTLDFFSWHEFIFKLYATDNSRFKISLHLCSEEIANLRIIISTTKLNSAKMVVTFVPFNYNNIKSKNNNNGDKFIYHT